VGGQRVVVRAIFPPRSRGGVKVPLNKQTLSSLLNLFLPNSFWGKKGGEKKGCKGDACMFAKRI
jgi:hypothetical protein